MNGDALRRTRTRLLALASSYPANPIASFVREIADAIGPELQSPREDVVDIPKSPEQAELMIKMGMAWLEANAPHRLKSRATQQQLETLARERNLSIELLAAFHRLHALLEMPNAIYTEAKTFEEAMIDEACRRLGMTRL